MGTDPGDGDLLGDRLRERLDPSSRPIPSPREGHCNRRALGAWTGRVVASALVEALLLAVASFCLAAPIAVLELALIRKTAPPTAWQLSDVSIDGSSFVLRWAEARDSVSVGCRRRACRNGEPHLLRDAVTSLLT
jgi:hypothetical protein